MNCLPVYRLIPFLLLVIAVFETSCGSRSTTTYNIATADPFDGTYLAKNFICANTPVTTPAEIMTVNDTTGSLSGVPVNNATDGCTATVNLTFTYNTTIYQVIMTAENLTACSASCVLADGCAVGAAASTIGMNTLTTSTYSLIGNTLVFFIPNSCGVSNTNTLIETFTVH